MNSSPQTSKRISPALIAGILVVVFGLTFLVMYFLNRGDQSTDPLNSDQAQGTQDSRHALSSKPAMGVEVPTLQFKSDAQAYMRQCLNAPIPKGYKLPDIFDQIPEYDFAVMKVGEHYPLFRGLEGDELVQVAWDNPMLYQSMILEAKAVREKYFPGSQPKVPD